MMCKLLLSWALFFTASGPILAHPITDSSETSYSLPGSIEEGRVMSPDELALSDRAYLSQSGTYLSYPALLTGDLSKDGLRTADFLPRQAVKEVLLEKQSRVNPFIRFLGTRKQFRKRGNASECFWKYCV